eukprot:s1368_g14.t1
MLSSRTWQQLRAHQDSGLIKRDGQGIEVLSQTSCWEKSCLFVGGFIALVQGAAEPIVAMFIGTCFDVIKTAPADVVLQEMQTPLLSMAVLALSVFLLAFLWQTLLMLAASQQALRWQVRYLKSLLSLDITWFDESDAAGEEEVEGRRSPYEEVDEDIAAALDVQTKLIFTTFMAKATASGKDVQKPLGEDSGGKEMEKPLTKVNDPPAEEKQSEATGLVLDG